LTAKW